MEQHPGPIARPLFPESLGVRPFDPVPAHPFRALAGVGLLALAGLMSRKGTDAHGVHATTELEAGAGFEPAAFRL